MSLTVVIPTRNRKNLTKKLVENLLTNFNYIDQIIIVDSSDNLENKTKLPYNKKVVYIHSKIKSAATQRNIGISLVDPKCRYLAFLDDDVSPTPNYFKDLTALLRNQQAVGVSGIAENPYHPKSSEAVKIFKAYRKFFHLYSDEEGTVLNSGVNTPVKRNLKKNPIVECKWLIGCAVWDYQKIKTCRFDDRFSGQSLGEDVLFSLKASKFGKLYVNRNVVLKHFESPVGRPNHLMHTRMWVRNRFYICEEILGSEMKISFHWCNIGKFLSFFLFIPKHPLNFIYGSFGMFLGYLDLMKEKYAS
jgi:glycosyltransferase involved in cell wall biosynthesis